VIKVLLFLSSIVPLVALGSILLKIRRIARRKSAGTHVRTGVLLGLLRFMRDVCIISVAIAIVLTVLAYWLNWGIVEDDPPVSFVFRLFVVCGLGITILLVILGARRTLSRG